MDTYLRPATLESALEALQGRPWTVLAGGTDVYPAHATGRPPGNLLDITAIPELRGISDADDHWRIGATTTWSDLIRAELPPMFEALVLAAREVGGVQIQNAGTVAGNLCNASPAADGVPALLALDAQVELGALAGTEVLPLAEFIVGPRRTRRRREQIVTAIRIPKPAGRCVSHFTKLGARRYLVISIAMVAGCLEIAADGRIASARIAVGACSPVASRLPDLESRLAGQPVSRDLAALATPECFASLAPIGDIRASADYRAEAARTLVARLLATLQDKA